MVPDKKDTDSKDAPPDTKDAEGFDEGSTRVEDMEIADDAGFGDEATKISQEDPAPDPDDADGFDDAETVVDEKPPGLT